MYLPKHFAAEENDGLAVIREFPFAVMVTRAEDGAPLIDHLPMIQDPDAGRLTLLGHLARANPSARALGVPTSATAVFSGPSAYISPNWYPSKHAGAQTVPTWNYLAVHVSGRVRPLSDYADKRRVVDLLSRRFEGDGPRAWKVDDEPEDFLRKMMGAITAFALDVETIEAKAKLSQNRASHDQTGVVQGLRLSQRRDAAALAEAMTARGIGA